MSQLTPIQPLPSPRPASSLVTLLRDALWVTLGGLALALLANQLSPKGLNLTRNYFPEFPTPQTTPISPISPLSPIPHPPTEDPATLARLHARGLLSVDTPEAASLFREPGYALGDVVFIDARAPRLYEEGHIPGALRLDHFQPDSTLAEVLPAALQARIVVVYCGGGDCEDSEYTALFLQESGLPPDRLRVFSGGMTAWRAARLPVEQGTRHSGQLEPQ